MNRGGRRPSAGRRPVGCVGRSRVKVIRVTPSEATEWTRAARDRGLPFSGWVRTLITNELRKAQS